MADFPFDDPALPVSSEPATALSEMVFAVYRQLAREREHAEREKKELAAAAAEAVAAWRRRLATVAAEAFHLRRIVASVRDPLRDAGVEVELARMELMVKRFDQVIAANGARVESLDGYEVDAALAELVDVESFVRGPVSVVRVRETIEPLVLVDGQVVLRPKAITEVPE